MNESKSTVCVLGAGISGLVTVKSMLDVGLEVICFEKEDSIAGRWNPNSEHPVPQSTITNLPHFMSGFSDFPIPDDFPLYLPADLYCTYFEMYAEHFNLLQHIKLGCKVTSAVPQARFNNDINGQHHWKIIYETKDNKQNEMEFDYLVVCSGFYQEPFVPKPLSEGISGFKGSVLHSVDYKSWKGFEGKKVVICGLGNTGGDIAVELSHHVDKLYLSTTRGAYLFGRMFKGGRIPLAATLNRFSQYLPVFLTRVLAHIVYNKIGNYVYNLNDVRLTPGKTAVSAIVNDDLCMRIAAGKVAVRTGIEKAVNQSVYFSDGTFADDIDVIIICTGYKRSFPFFDEQSLQMEEENKYIPLYKGVFSPNLQNNIAFVGMSQVVGAIPIASEMQARYVAEVFRGNVTLPERKVMEDYIESHRLSLKALGDIKEYNMILKPWLYYDELAEEIGCRRPSLFNLMMCDPVLAWNLCTAYSPYEYRLIGPNKWDGARDAILRQPQRMFAFMAGSRKVV